MKRYQVTLIGCLALMFASLQAAPSTQWFEEARFGMFIHWGLYSKLANNWDGQRYYGIGECPADAGPALAAI